LSEKATKMAAATISVFGSTSPILSATAAISSVPRHAVEGADGDEQDDRAQEVHDREDERRPNLVVLLPVTGEDEGAVMATSKIRRS
jgi:hypothetical protein